MFIVSGVEFHKKTFTDFSVSLTLIFIMYIQFVLVIHKFQI